MAQILDVTQILLAGQSPDANIRTTAEAQLKAFQEQNFPVFVASLSAELANGQKPADSRRLAGLILKNMLDAKDEVRKAELHTRWVALDPALKNGTREALIVTLHAEVQDVAHTAALVIAKVASIDLPRKEWPTLIGSLLNNMSMQPPNPGVRQATLEALGYVCEEMAQRKDTVLSTEEINMILTAVVAGMGQAEPIAETRLAATQALSNAIEFASTNFDNENERNYIMQVVCQGTLSPDQRIRYASFECLHEIAALYYSKLPAYMQEIYGITVKAIKEDSEEVALQAIEFWSTICDTELEIMEDPGEEPNHGFIKSVCPHFVPILMELLTKQEEGQEQDETSWNISMAAATCLGLMAKVAGNEIVPYVMPFVYQNISKNNVPEDWRLREAATCAFGSILDGPTLATLQDIVKQAMPFLLQAMKDPNPYVKDTTAWTIGRIFEFLARELRGGQGGINNDELPPIIKVLVEGLAEEPHIAYRVCCAIGQLATVFRNSTDDATSPLSPFFKDIVAALLHTASRYSSIDQAKVQISAFEAINDLVRAASRDTVDTVAELIPVVLQEIVKTFDMPVVQADAREKQAEIQGQLCGVLQVLISKLSESEDTKALVAPQADNIFGTLLHIFRNRSATVHEEAMLAVGSFTYACGSNFTKYMPEFFTYLRVGLQNYQEWQVCLSTVGVLGDVCRNIEDQIAPYCDDLMTVLVEILGRNDVHRTIKPQILSAFGDVALVLGDRFETYLPRVKVVLMQAMQLSIHQQTQCNGDEDIMEYNNELRHGILDAYSGILQGIGNQKSEQYIKPDVPLILAFLSSIARDELDADDEDVNKAAINLLGDLCSVISGMGGILRESQPKDWEKLVGRGYGNDSSRDVEWAIQKVQAAINS